MNRPIRLLLPAVLLLAARCTFPPIIHHDGLPAWTPSSDYDHLRCGAGLVSWYEDDEIITLPGIYAGGRTGQSAGPITFEEGVHCIYCGSLFPFFSFGVGLKDPTVTLRGEWSPTGLFEAPIWQASLLVGTKRPVNDFGFSVGPRVSRVGMGGALLLDYTHGNVAFRTELSGSVPALWADTTIQGSVVSATLWVEPRSRHREPTPTATRNWTGQHSSQH